MIKHSFMFKLLVSIFILSVVIGLITTIVLYNTSSFEKVVEVKEKYIRYRRRSSNYHVVDTDDNIYQIGNLWFKGDFDRAEDYAKLKVGSKYKVKGYGYRVPLLDMYKKIYHLEKV